MQKVTTSFVDCGKTKNSGSEMVMIMLVSMVVVVYLGVMVDVVEVWL